MDSEGNSGCVSWSNCPGCLMNSTCAWNVESESCGEAKAFDHSQTLIINSSQCPPMSENGLNLLLPQECSSDVYIGIILMLSIFLLAALAFVGIQNLRIRQLRNIEERWLKSALEPDSTEDADYNDNQ